MNMGGIGQGFNLPPPRMNPSQGFMPLNQPLGGFNPNINLGMGNTPNFGMGMMAPLGSNPRVNPPQTNFKPI